MDTNHAARGSDRIDRIDRIDTIARRAGMERSLYLGEAIGHTLAIAWDAFGALGAWLTRRGSAAPAARQRAAE